MVFHEREKKKEICLDRSLLKFERERDDNRITEKMDNNNNNNAVAAAAAAASVVVRKSTAKPRPIFHVPPRGIGPITEPNKNDVLCGRGGRINNHAGNVQFRYIIQAKKKQYLNLSTKKLEKAHIAASIVHDIRTMMDPPGRFLKEDRVGAGVGLWFDIGDASAIKKTGQALREDAPDIRPVCGGAITGTATTVKNTAMIDDVNNDGNNSGSGGGVYGTIVVVAKCPIAGKSKTRLIPLLGEQGSVLLAKSMLSDVLKTIDGCSELDNVRKVLLYAPGNAEGFQTMKGIFDELDLTYDQNHRGQRQYHSNEWHLLPMLSSSSSPPSSSSSNSNDSSSSSSSIDDLKSHDLGAKLEDALIQVRLLQQSQKQKQKQKQRNTNKYGVVFLGMDAPILPLNDIVVGLRKASSSYTSSLSQPQQPVATLCPAYDGGYVMLCVPPNADPSKTFLSTQNMYWSHPLTAISQIKTLTDQNIQTQIGRVMHDIDVPNDVIELCLKMETIVPKETKTTFDGGNNSNNKKNLDYPSGWECTFSKNDNVNNNSNSTNSNTNCSATMPMVTSRHPICYFTRQALTDAGIFPLTKDSIASISSLTKN